MGSAPRAPDPYDQAKAQRGENIWSSQYNTIASNANQITPYGTITNAPGQRVPIYDEKGKRTGWGTQWNQTTQLSPEEQAIFNIDQSNRKGLGTFAGKQIGALDETLSKPFNTEGLPEWSFYDKGPELQQAQYGGTDRQAIEDAIAASTRRATQSQWAADDAQMAARGMGSPGSDYGYKVDQARGDVMAEAGRQGYLASGQESRAAEEAARAKSTDINSILQQEWLNQNQRADQSNNVRTGMFGERQQERNQIVNEIAALMGGGQVMVPQAQAFQGSQVNPFDIAGAQNQAYANEMTNYQNKMSGLFGLGGAALQMANPFSMFGAGKGMFG